MKTFPMSTRGMISRAMGEGGQGGSSFSPLDLSGLFAWYDPSDLSTLFQDSAGTTPVTADGQPVGRMLDKSGNGNHVTQSTSASRPTYRTDGTLHWIETDGVNDHIFAAVSMSGSVIVTGWAGNVLSKPASNSTIVGYGNTTDATSYSSLICSSGGTISLQDFASGSVGSSSVAIPNTGFNYADNHYAISSKSGAGGEIIWDGGIVTTGVPVITNLSSVTRLAIGALIRTSTIPGAAQKINQIVVGTTLLTASEKSKLAAYLSSKAGV